MAALPADDGAAVLGKIMADGTFDDLRQQLVNQLKQNVRARCRQKQTAWECTVCWAPARAQHFTRLLATRRP